MAREIRSGFQRPNSAERYFGDFRPGRAANDNLPRAANDNIRPPSPSMIPASSATSLLLDAALMLSPWGRALSLLMGLYELYQLLNEEPDKNINQAWAPGGYTVCPGEGGCQGPYGYTTLGAGACGPTLPNRCGNRSGALTKLPIVGTPSRIIVYGKPDPLTGFFQPHIVFNKLGAGPFRSPEFVTDWPIEVPDLAGSPEPRPAINPETQPQYDPMNEPIKNPWLEPDPFPYELVPYREPNPDRSPVEQPWRGPLPPVRIRPDERTDPRRRPDVRPDQKGDRDTRIETRTDPRTRLRPLTRIIDVPRTPPSRPGKNTRERKYRAGLTGTLRVVVNAITESRDFIEALWKALPKDKRSRPEKGRRKVFVQQMLKDLYDNWLDLDLPRAVKEVIANELQDRLYGKAGQLSAKGVQRAAEEGYYQRPVGVQAGDRYRPRVPPPKGDLFDQANQFFDDNLPRYSFRDVQKAVGWH